MVIIKIGFYPWPAWYMVQIIFNFNFVWQNTLIFNVNVCLHAIRSTSP